MLGVLWANLVLILSLGAMVAWRLFRLVASRDRAGAKLHLRFVMLFAGAAVIPAIVVALFFGLLVTRGVDSWFSARIRTLVDSSTMVSRAYMQDHRTRIYSDTRDVAAALEPMQAMLASDPQGYRLRLEAIVSQGYFDAIYVIDSKGQVLAKAEGASPKAYPLPSPAKLREALRDFVISDADVHDSLTSLYRLRGYDDAYLYGIRHVDSAIFSLVKDTSDASAFYADLDKNRARIQSVFQLSYAETALLVLVGALAVGMAVANSISQPVARLVIAADLVAEGDLSARVPIGESPEEIEVLSEAFNRMAGDLQAQQAALRWALIRRVMSSKVSTRPPSASCEARMRRRRISPALGTSTSISASPPSPAR
jgi:two-component system nitrogen regulation sensor histidine kinase NtrY